MNKLLRSKRADFRKSAKAKISKYYVAGDDVDEESLEGKANLTSNVDKICGLLIKSRRVTQNDQEFVRKMILVHFKKVTKEQDSDSE